MEKVKTEFMLVMRDGLDWLKEKKALDNKTYDRFYSELVDGIAEMKDDKFSKLLDLIEEKILKGSKENGKKNN